MAKAWEDLEGYVVDIACLRKYPQVDVLARARDHSKECALMGHCVESGYGLVSEQGIVQLLEPAVTPEVVQAIRQSPKSSGIKLKVHRKAEEEEMRSNSVEEVS